MNFVPKVMPINELKNTGNISRICKESNVPIIITKKTAKIDQYARNEINSSVRGNV